MVNIYIWHCTCARLVVVETEIKTLAMQFWIVHKLCRWVMMQAALLVIYNFSNSSAGPCIDISSISAYWYPGIIFAYNTYTGEIPRTNDISLT